MLPRYDKKSLAEIYASAVATVSILALVVATLLGIVDVVKLVSPTLMLDPALYEKYQSNDSYTEYGLFRKELSPAAITEERIAGYEKLLRIERRSTLQRLFKVGLTIAIVAAMNGFLLLTYRRRDDAVG